MRAASSPRLITVIGRGLVALVFGVLLAGCQSLTRPPVLPSPPLLSPAAAGVAIQATQQLTVQHGDNTRQLLVVLALTPQQLSLSGLSGLGQRLLDIQHDGNSVQSHYYHDMTLPLPAEWIVAQLQLAYWPLAALQHSWQKPWHVVAHGQQRTLYLEQRPLITLTYRSVANAQPSAGDQRAAAVSQHLPSATEQVVIEHQAMNTTLTVTTLQAQITGQAQAQIKIQMKGRALP